jgi:GT2 family glycosyltransferase
MSEPRVTIAISTKNRCDELRRALASCRRQSGSVEILVLDDGSTDRTSEMVAREFPEARLLRFENSEGYIRRRNQAAREASAPLLLCLDDDAEIGGNEIATVLEAGFSHDRVGAVAIPYIDVRQDPRTIKQSTPLEGGPYVLSSYVGTAHALRRDVFLALGGYRERFFHQGEEGDYCIRLLDAGYVVVGIQADPILHFESPRRDFERMDVFGRRNDVLFAWCNVPLPYFPIHLAATLFNGIRFGISQRRLQPMVRGLARGCLDAVRVVAPRTPVRTSTYRLSRHLKKMGPLPFAQVIGRLPPMRG